MIRNSVAVSSNMLWLRVLTNRLELQIDMPMPMHMFDMWLWLLALATVLVLAAVVAVHLSTRTSQRVPSVTSTPSRIENPHTMTLVQEADQATDETTKLQKVVELVRPTLTDDERRILNEIVMAGGEILQSDLPEKSAFSKATVSKLIKSLETMGIVTREKHKWTYWVRISEKLISRTKNT